MHRRAYVAGALLAALLVVATACSSSTSSPPTSTSTSTSTTTSTSTGSPSGSGATDVSSDTTTTMSAENFFFTPAALSGTASQKLTITLANDGSVAHNFSIDSENINVTLQPGQSQDIKVTFPQSGSVEFYCLFHKTSGMVGELQIG